MKKIILIPALAFLLMSCGGGGGENTSSSHSTGFVPPVINTFNITWKNYDGAVLRTDQVSYGEMPHYGTAPTRSEDECYTYSFKGWTPAIVAATANATYTATYEAHPKYEINAAQYAQATMFKGRSFSMHITAPDHYWDEYLYHNENNEIFDKYLDTWDPVEGKGTYNYHRLYKFGDYYDSYVGQDKPTYIDYSYQYSKSIDDHIDAGEAYDYDQYVGSVTSFEFDDYTYNPTNHIYEMDRTGVHYTLMFHGTQLREATFDDGVTLITAEFFDYDVTVVPMDNDFTAYIAYQYPEKEQLRELAANFDNLFTTSIDFDFTYEVDGLETQTYHVKSLNNTTNHTHYTKLDYDGLTPYGGEKNTSFVYDWDSEETYINVSGNTYTAVTDPEQEYNYSDPFIDTIGSTVNLMKFFFHENIVNNEVGLETWLNYEKSCGEVEFERVHTFQVGPDTKTYDIHFDLEVNNNGDGFVITNFQLRYINEYNQALVFTVESISYEVAPIDIIII